jgi:hypothetical protein
MARAIAVISAVCRHAPLQHRTHTTCDPSPPQPPLDPANRHPHPPADLRVTDPVQRVHQVHRPSPPPSTHRALQPRQLGRRPHATRHHSFPTTAARGNAGRSGRSGPAVPPTKADCTQWAAAKRRTWAQAWVAARRGGTRNQRRPSRQAACQRHDASGKAALAAACRGGELPPSHRPTPRGLVRALIASPAIRQWPLRPKPGSFAMPSQHGGT